MAPTPPSTNAEDVDPNELNSFLRDFEAGKPNSHLGSAGPASSHVASKIAQVRSIPEAGSSSKTGRLSHSNSRVILFLHESESNVTSQTSQSSEFAFGRSVGSSSTIPSTTHWPERLPCEFAGYDHCPQTFSINDFQGWLTHIVTRHLDYTYPQKAICWFCDGFPVNEDSFPSAESDDNERRTFFSNRLLHIRNHFIEGTERTIRPDFYLLDHLRKHGLITQELYDKAKQFSELPEEYRLPADMTEGHPPAKHERPNMGIVSMRERSHRDAIKRPKCEQRDGPSSTGLNSRTAAESSRPGRSVIVHQDFAHEE